LDRTLARDPEALLAIPPTAVRKVPVIAVADKQQTTPSQKSQPEEREQQSTGEKVEPPPKKPTGLTSLKIPPVALKQQPHPQSESQNAQESAPQTAQSQQKPLQLSLPMKKAHEEPQQRENPNEPSFEEMEAAEREKAHLIRRAHLELTAVNDWLYISGSGAAEDVSRIVSSGITHVVNAAAMVTSTSYPDSVRCLRLWTADAAGVDLFAIFPVVLEFAVDARSKGGRVLVHCSQGISRSCALSIALIMFFEGLSYTDAMAVVKQKRRVCSPNAGFLAQLIQFEQFLSDVKSSTTRRFVWRCGVFAHEYPQQGIVAKLQPHEDTVLDPRGVYVVASKDSDVVYIWSGSDASGTAYAAAFVAAARKHAEFVQKYLRLGSRVEEVVNSSLSSVGLDGYTVSSTEQEKYPSEEWLGASTAAQGLACEDRKDSWNGTTHLPPSSVQRNCHATDGHDSEHDGELSARETENRSSPPDHSQSGRPYRMIDLDDDEDLTGFEEDDLDSDKVFLFAPTQKDGLVYVWVGKKTHFYTRTDDDEAVCQVIEEYVERMAEYDLTADQIEETVVLYEGREPDEFWECFD
jgi:protein-tyrosine phosphatase